jgi:Flp pilus assembly protein TadD
MSRRRGIVAVITGSCLALGGMTSEAVAPAVGATGGTTPTAPQQLVHAYPLGAQRLCCNGQTGLSGTTSSTAPSRSAPPVRATSAPGRARTAGKPAGDGASGAGSAVLLIGLGVVAALVVACGTAAYRTRRRTGPVLGRGSPPPPAVPHSNGTAPAASVTTGNARPGAEPGRDRPPAPLAAASDAEEQEFHRLDDQGDAGGAFNLGVVLHQRGDLAGAKAAYERAEQRGDPDAAFNLGILLYEAGDLDGAEAAWRQSAGRGHVRAAANLLFLSRHRRESEADPAIQSEARGLAEFEELYYRRADENGAATGAFNLGAMLHQQGDTAGAAAAYERAERRGDPDAAFNLGILLYEAGDLDGAEAAWRRSVGRGHARAAENLEFLLRHRHELETAGVAGEEGEDR